MSKVEFFTRYKNPPKKCFFEPDTETCFVSQSEVMTSGLTYQLHQYGFDTLAQKMEDLRDKFGYADCTKIADFRTSMNKYVEGKQYFEALPSEIRRQYNDTPELFYDDCLKNPDTAYKAGFISEEFYKNLKEKNNNDVVDTSDINTNVNVDNSLSSHSQSSESAQ